MFVFKMLISLFERCMKRRGVKESDPYDWEKQSTGDNAAITVAPQPTSILPTAAPKHAKHPQTDNNQENIEPTDNKEVPPRNYTNNLIEVLILIRCRFIWNQERG